MACDPLDETEEGKALVVTDEENCLKELVQSEGGAYPAIPVALSDTEVVLRDGSVNQPFQLPHLQVQTGGAFQRLMIQDSNGVWYAYEPSTWCVDRKLVVRDGSFELVDDVIPQVATADLCEVSACDDYDYLIGVKEIELTCDDEPTTYLQLVLVPKDLCPSCVEEEPTE
jgi:hypothetical protein